MKLVKESLCDGLGACIGRCPFGALTVGEREADAFDEEEAQQNMEQVKKRQHAHHHGGCPGAMAQQWDKPGAPIATVESGSALRQWPVELKLLNPVASYFQDVDLLVSADCVPFAFANFHQRFLKGKALVVFCPKLDNAHEEYIEKMTLILKENNIRSITVAHMEVPCCSATTHVVEEAVKRSGKQLVIRDYTISLQGEMI